MKALALGHTVMVCVYLLPVIVLLTVTRIGAAPVGSVSAAPRGETCYEVTLADNSILDATAKLYYGGSAQWGTRRVPPIYACPAERIRELHHGADGLYIGGMILIATESGIMEDDEYAWSVAVHELVHHIQDVSGALDAVSTCQSENRAYAIQKQWLAAQESEWTIDRTDECNGAVLADASVL